MKNLGPDDYAELLSGQFEGDMVLSPEEIELLIGEGRGGRTGLIDRNVRWTDNIVPYQIREEDFSKYFLFNFEFILLSKYQPALKYITFISEPRDSTRHHV